MHKNIVSIYSLVARIVRGIYTADVLIGVSKEADEDVGGTLRSCSIARNNAILQNIKYHAMCNFLEFLCHPGVFTHPLPLPGGEFAHQHVAFPSWKGQGVGSLLKLHIASAIKIAQETAECAPLRIESRPPA